MKTVLVCFILVVLCVSVSAVHLTTENFAEVTSGKNHFIKFYAPWCGHCKRLAPDWEKLTQEFDGQSGLVIGEVDCTENQEICSEHGVSGYPTLKYWNDDSDGERYNGERSFDALKTFVEESLASPCSVTDPSSCNEKERKYITKFQAKSSEDVAAQITRLEGMVDSSMKPELKAWIKQRLNILKQL
jgi:protein disulfide-isomerase A6